MTRPNDNTNSAETLGKQKPMRFSDDTIRLPTHEQLAMIAATLARKTNEEPDKLVHAALEIWHAAGRTLFHMASVSVVTASFDCFKAGRTISRDEFFKKLLPESKRNRTAEVGEIGKAFVRHIFGQEFGRKPSDDEFLEFYHQWNPGCAEKANELVWDFGYWYKERVAESHSAAAKNPRKKNAKLARTTC